MSTSLRIRAALVAAGVAAAALGSAGVASGADPFTYDPPGKLVSGSGKGRVDMNVYAPGIRFPIESGPAFANSQVWGHGGNSGTGSQCDIENFSYPWHDNYCETRDWDMPLCPSGAGHQGQDIRAASCKPGVHTAVAVVDGTITSIGSYSVYLTAADGTRFDYLHEQDVIVKEGQKVKRGDPIGKVSNKFGDSLTTVHLHFNIHQNVAGVGAVYVPPYLSIVHAYETLEGIGVMDAGAPEAAPPAPAPTASVQEAPVTTPAPADSAAPPAEPSDGGGCTLAIAGARSSKAPWLGAALALTALGLGAARRRRGPSR